MLFACICVRKEIEIEGTLSAIYYIASQLLFCGVVYLYDLQMSIVKYFLVDSIKSKYWRKFNFNDSLWLAILEPFRT